ncbi:MAG: glycosyltransferase [Bacteroidota bacterium]
MQIFIFSPIPYSFLHQRPQKLADQYVEKGHQVTFIEPCGLTEYLSGRKKGLPLLVIRSVWYFFLGLAAIVIPRMLRKPALRGDGDEQGEGPKIASMPIIVPNNRVNSAMMERLNASIYRQAIRGLFRHIDPNEETLAIVENPLWGLVLQRGDFTRLAYDCIDEISLFAGRGSVERMECYERRLIEMSDAVCVTAEKLEETLRPKVLGRPLVRLPNGVDYDYFQRRIQECGPPDALAGVRRPIVGYVGVLRNWMDYALVEYLARTLTQVSFVLVGPVDFENRLESIRKIPNVILMGRREYRDVPAFINAFDVCVIPFLPGPVSNTTNPVKLFEYFALGRPVVSTRLRELEKFADQGLLRMADNREEFASAVTDALAERTPGVKEMRKEVARAHSWKSIADQLFAVAMSREDSPPRRRGAEGKSNSHITSKG